MASEEEQLRQGLVQQRVYEGSARTLQARLDIINAAMNEFALASSTLEGIKSQKSDADALIPVGGGSFVRAKLADISKIVVGVGAGVAIEKPIDLSITEIKDRIAGLDKARTTLQEQLNQTLIRLEENREKLNEIVKKQGGESITVI
ncbi:prefoldin subunit alpha [Candidatus Bathyarchaeota archaeon]|nr:prefoldin subunit alpha [Candidatus Bathyarchaeota archaeon]